MTTVYLLYHIREDENSEDEKLIGIYTTMELAEEAKKRVESQPGFIDYPDDFSIFPHKLNRDGWAEGFIVTDD